MSSSEANYIHVSKKRKTYEEDLSESLDKAKQNVEELMALSSSKDSEILKLNQMLLHYEDTIKNQICEIHTLRSEIEYFRYYKPHPKDTYLINFGHSKYRNWTYRNIISSREGVQFCKWVLYKNTPDTTSVKEFKKYLQDLKYVL